MRSSKTWAKHKDNCVSHVMVLVAQKQQQKMGMDSPHAPPPHPPTPAKRLDRLMLLIPVTQWFRRGHPPPPPPPPRTWSDRRQSAYEPTVANRAVSQNNRKPTCKPQVVGNTTFDMGPAEPLKTGVSISKPIQQVLPCWHTKRLSKHNRRLCFSEGPSAQYDSPTPLHKAATFRVGLPPSVLTTSSYVHD